MLHHRRVMLGVSIAVGVIVAAVGFASPAAAAAASLSARIFAGSFQGCTSPDPNAINTSPGTMYTTDPTRNTLLQCSIDFCGRQYNWHVHSPSDRFVLLLTP